MERPYSQSTTCFEIVIVWHPYQNTAQLIKLVKHILPDIDETTAIYEHLSRCTMATITGYVYRSPSRMITKIA